MSSSMLYVRVREAAEGLKMEISVSRDILETLLTSGRETLHANEIDFRTPALPAPEGDEKEREHEVVTVNLYAPEG